MNFSNEDKKASLDKAYTDILTGSSVADEITVPSCGYIILKA